MPSPSFHVTDKLRRALEEAHTLGIGALNTIVSDVSDVSEEDGQDARSELSKAIGGSDTVESLSWPAVSMLVKLLNSSRNDDNDNDPYCADELLMGSYVVDLQVEEDGEGEEEDDEEISFRGAKGMKYGDNANYGEVYHYHQHPITKAHGVSVFGDFYLSVIAMGFAGYWIAGSVTSDRTSKYISGIIVSLITFLAEAILLVIRFTRADAHDERVRLKKKEEKERRMKMKTGRRSRKDPLRLKQMNLHSNNDNHEEESSENKKTR